MLSMAGTHKRRADQYKTEQELANLRIQDDDHRLLRLQQDNRRLREKDGVNYAAEDTLQAIGS